MVARVFCGFGSGVCESLPVQLVNDIFFLHERGKRLGYYTSTLRLSSPKALLIDGSLSLSRVYWTSVCWVHARRWLFLEIVLLRRSSLCVRYSCCSIFPRRGDQLQTAGTNPHSIV